MSSTRIFCCPTNYYLLTGTMYAWLGSAPPVYLPIVRMVQKGQVHFVPIKTPVGSTTTRSCSIQAVNIWSNQLIFACIYHWQRKKISTWNCYESNVSESKTFAVRSIQFKSHVFFYFKVLVEEIFHHQKLVQGPDLSMRIANSNTIDQNQFVSTVAVMIACRFELI